MSQHHVPVLSRPARVYRTHGHTVVELTGEIDLTVVDEIAAELDAVGTHPGESVVIDLSPATFFGSSGLNLLCGARRRVQARGGHLQVVCPHSLTVRVLRLAGPFRVVRTLAEALQRTPA
ncbi:hypothetical protein GCM10010277_07590 [Streptomyces longisporoflavus]|uniref:STAS domain-containing protein n=1 Tax=Streptomyces longisporoflavus TaxID=28044 RepID=UPI00167E81DC|nr:STAS domain-containing protein [Streptomyces longisporoflavus]GGV26176.1 hypothetical protein GCM10010277_07590 [Streptomyces longisporoflavus]